MDSVGSVVLIVIITCTGFVSGQDHVSLKARIREDAIYLECKIDLTGLDVYFFSPNNTLIGSCSAPIPKEYRKETFVECGHNITQFLDKETTVLRLEKSNKWLGEWTCKHGSARSSDSVNITKCMIESNCDQEKSQSGFPNFAHILLLILIPLMIVVPLLIWKCRHKCKDTCNGRKGKDDAIYEMEETEMILKMRQTERSPLLLQEDDAQSEILCTKCNKSCNMLCINCKRHYCIACLKVHLDTTDHFVATLENAIITTRTFNTKCEVCEDKLSKEYCITHEYLVCTSCNCFNMPFLECKRTKILLPISHYTNCLTSPKDVRYERSFRVCGSQEDSLQRRVCGIIALPENTILIADTQNQELLWFSNYEVKDIATLPGEPVAIVFLFESNVAISFPQQRNIIEYQIKFKLTENKAKLDLDERKIIDLKTYGKPYNIAYSNGFYAVELGKGHSGYIGIFEYDDGKFMKKINIGSVYFTGCTIRLAMDNTSEKLFVSAAGIKQILCINRANGEQTWSTEMPSPRAVLFFPTDFVGYETLLVANKRSDVIYKVNPTGGKREVFLFEDRLSGPRFMAYDKCSKFLYVYSDNEIVHVYRYPCEKS